MSATAEQVNPYKSPGQGEVVSLLEHPLYEGAFDLEGFLDSDTTHIESVDLIYEKDCDRGAITREAITFEDGVTYPVTTGVPAESKSDTAVVFKTAWLTSSKGGHNMRTFLRIMQLGYPVIMVGSVGEIVNPKLSLKERLAHATQTNLPKISHDVDQIATLKIQQHRLREEGFFSIGESQGGSVGAGSRLSIYGDYVAMPFPEELKPKELPAATKQFVGEGLELASIGLRKIFSRDRALRYYPATAITNPEHLVKELLKIRMFISGQSGRLLLGLNEETVLRMTAFEDDGWSQIDTLEKIIAARQNSWLERRKGRHLTIAEPYILGGLALRLQAITTERGPHGSFKEVDFMGKVVPLVAKPNNKPSTSTGLAAAA